MTASQGTHVSLLGLWKEFSTGVFRKKVALRDVTLLVPRGHVVGLLGPNGSGKSTLMKHLLGFLRPTRGAALVFDQPAHLPEVRARLGYLPETPRFQRFLTGRQALRYLSSLHSLGGAACERRIDELLELVDLRDASTERIHGYSKGMVQRLAIAQALLNQPELVILDEPMSGLDPVGRSEVRRLVSRIHGQYPTTTIFFSSHVLSDVEALCTYVVLLRAGSVLRAAPLSEILAEQPSQFEVLLAPEHSARVPGLTARFSARGDLRGTTLVADNAQDLTSLLSELAKNGMDPLSVQSRRHRLEEALFRDREGEAFPAAKNSAGNVEGTAA